MRTAALIELCVLWLAWAYPYLFYAPKVQKRKSITKGGASKLGLLLECVGIFMAWFEQTPGPPRTDLALMLAALMLGVIEDVMIFKAEKHLGRQFRIQAGLYEDHQLIRTGP
jgi:hypothetical protein